MLFIICTSFSVPSFPLVIQYRARWRWCIDSALFAPAELLKNFVSFRLQNDSDICEFIQRRTCSTRNWQPFIELKLLFFERIAFNGSITLLSKTIRTIYKHGFTNILLLYYSSSEACTPIQMMHGPIATLLSTPEWSPGLRTRKTQIKCFLSVVSFAHSISQLTANTPVR